MSDLTTAAAVKTQLKITETSDDTLIGAYVTQASRMVETFCNRQFANTAGTLTYDTYGPHIDGRRLHFGQDVLSITSLTNGGDGVLPTTAYRLWPLNTSPKYAVELLPEAGYAWETSSTNYPEGAIVVVGSLGYCTDATRPADVTLAATKLAAWLYQNRDNDGTTVQLGDGSLAIPAEAPALVFKLLGRYVRVEFAA